MGFCAAQPARSKFCKACKKLCYKHKVWKEWKRKFVGTKYTDLPSLYGAHHKTPLQGMNPFPLGRILYYAFPFSLRPPYTIASHSTRSSVFHLTTRIRTYDVRMYACMPFSTCHSSLFTGNYWEMWVVWLRIGKSRHSYIILRLQWTELFSYLLFKRNLSFNFKYCFIRPNFLDIPVDSSKNLNPKRSPIIFKKFWLNKFFKVNRNCVL